MKVSWSGMPTAEDVRRTAEAWLERVPANITVSRGINPAADLRLVFGIDHLSSGDVSLLGRERFRKHSVLFLDDYLNASKHGVKKRAVWLAKMVRILLFPSEAEASLFRIMYPDVRTPRRAVPVVQVPEKKVQKRHKKRKKKEIDTEFKAWDAASDDTLANFEKSLDSKEEEPEEPIEVDPMEEYEKRLDESARGFWSLVRKLAG